MFVLHANHPVRSMATNHAFYITTGPDWIAFFGEKYPLELTDSIWIVPGCFQLD